MNSKINIKLLFFIFALLFLILAIITIRGTYARYVTSLTSEGSIELGSWLINVNEQNILDNADLSQKIIPYFSVDDDYIAEGKLAPAATSYVEITIDYSKVTVPFQYDISFKTESSALEDLNLVSYSVDGGTEVTVADPEAPVTDSITPDGTTTSRTLKLNFTWYDGTGETFDDFSDTNFALNNTDVGLRFNLQFTQLQPTT